MPHTSTRHGLRVTVRLHGTVVEQRVHWRTRGAILLGGDGPDAIPTPSGQALVGARFESSDRVAIEPIEPTASPGILMPGQGWRWSKPRTLV